MSTLADKIGEAWAGVADAAVVPCWSTWHLDRIVIGTDPFWRLPVCPTCGSDDWATVLPARAYHAIGDLP